MQVQFGKNVADMGFYCCFTDKQLSGNLFIGIALAQQLHDFLFPSADAFVPYVDRKRVLLFLSIRIFQVVSLL